MTDSPSSRGRRSTLDATRLLEMIRTLRAPGGCPWDQAQQLQDTRTHLLEEAHEVAAALDDYLAAKDHEKASAAEALREELGDLLFQVAFIVELCRELAILEPQDVVDSIHSKMIERHPHVYGNSDQALETAEDVAKAWAINKRSQKPERSALSGVPATLPALTAALRLGEKASGLGFDWPSHEPVRAKLDEELRELDQAIAVGEQPSIEEELGDVLLTTSSLARHLGVDPERSLALSNRKFTRRFQAIESSLEEGLSEEQAEELWQSAKKLDL